MSSGSHGESDPSNEFGTIACVWCRKNHKRCDKTVPSCKNCSLRGLVCEYMTPKRRQYPKRIRNSNVSENSRNSSQVEEEQHEAPIVHLTLQQVLDIYVNVLYGMFSLMAVPPNDLEQYFTEMQVGMPLSHDVNALIYSIRALCEQMKGMLDAANESVKLALSELAHTFHVLNRNTVPTYSYLSFYESGFGRLKNARFYLTFGKAYVQELEENPDENYDKLRVAKRGIAIWELNCSGDNILDFKRWPESFEKNVGVPLPPELSDLFHREIDASNYQVFLQVAELLPQLSLNDPLLKIHVESRRSQEFWFSVVIHGFRLQILKQCGCESELAEKTALILTDCFENEYFCWCTPLTLSVVICVAQYHLELVKSIERGEKIAFQTSVNYYTVLQKDLHALQSLNNKLKRVELFHGDLLKEMSEVIQHKKIN